MSRYPDWQLRLEAFVRERARMAFTWGSNDCAMFAAAEVEAITGERVLPALRGYDSARSALRLIELHGGLYGLATLALGAPISPNLASIGDVVLVNMQSSEALGVCNGTVVIGPGASGLECAPLSAALAAWRV